MRASLLLLLAVSGVTTVQSEAVHILGQNYELISLPYLGTNPPSLIYFTDVNSSIVVFVDKQVLDLGDQFLNDPVPLVSFTPYPVYSFTNNLQNLLTCKDDIRNNCNQRPYFYVSNNEFMVSTGDLPYAVQCHGDVNGQRVFIVAGKERSSSVGKLYAVNTLNYKRVHFWITAEEVVGVGDRISAVAVSQTNGDILMSAETLILGKKGFDMILLKPLAGIEEFTAAVTQSKEAIFRQLDINLHNRINALNLEVSRLRALVTDGKLYQSVHDLPSRHTVVNGSYEDSLKEVINNLSEKMLQLYKENVHGENSEEVTDNHSCLRIWNDLYTKATEHATLMHLHPRLNKNFVDADIKIPTVKCMDVKIENSLCGSNDVLENIEKVYRYYRKLARFNLGLLITITESNDRGIEYKEINLLDQVYHMHPARTYDIDAPITMDYMSNTSSLMVYIKRYGGYTTGRNFAPLRTARWYTPESKLNFTDINDNEVTCLKDGKASVKIRKANKATFTYQVPIPASQKIIQCVGDFKRGRVFFLSRDMSDVSENENGKVYVMSLKKLSETSIPKVQEIVEVGHDITAMAIHPSSGIIYLSQHNANETSFTLVVLRPTLDEAIKQITNFPTETPLPNSTYLIDGDDFLYAVREGEQMILNLFEKNWNSKVENVILEYGILNELEKVYGQKQQGPIHLRTEAILAVVDRSNAPLNETLRHIFDELLYKYIKNIVGLPDKSLQQLRLARICPTALYNFRDSMINEIPNTLERFPELRNITLDSPALLEPGLSFYDKKTCSANNTDNISCLPWQAMLHIKARIGHNRNYLRQLHQDLLKIKK